MVMHARSGGTLEVMGLLLGKIDVNTMYVMDSFALPVEGTETRVNAQAQAYEYMSSYITSAKLVSIQRYNNSIKTLINLINRLVERKTQSVGTIPIRVTVAGCRELMSRRK